MVILAAAVRFESAAAGVVELFFEPRGIAGDTAGPKRCLRTFCELASCYYQARAWNQAVARRGVEAHGDEFARLVHRGLNVTEIAFAAANEARRLLEVDRVSVAVMRRGRQRIEAVSGQDKVDRRANAIRLLGNLAETVARFGEPLWFRARSRINYRFSLH